MHSSLLGLTPVVTNIIHNLAITILQGLMLTNCCIINNQSVHYVILPSRSYTWEKIINGGIALSGALSLVCISMIARTWRLAVVAKQKFGMQNYFIVQLFLFIAQIRPNYSYHLEKLSRYIYCNIFRILYKAWLGSIHCSAWREAFK